MRKRIQQHICAFAAGVTLAGQFVPPALADGAAPAGQAPDIKASPLVKSQAVEIDAANIKVNRRDPIPFKPITLNDGAAAAGVAATDIMTLPNGQTMTVDQYLAELNKVEQQFNAMGYSLRSADDRTTIQEAVVDTKQLEKQTGAFAAKHPESAEGPKSFEALEQEFQGMANDPQRLRDMATKPAGGDVSAASVSDRTLPWNWSLGNSNWFSVFINSYIRLWGSADAAWVQAKGRVGGSIVGYTQTLADATATMYGPRTGAMNAHLTVGILGSTVWDYNQNFNSNLDWHDSYTWNGIDFSATYRFALGPIPMAARVGARGSTGLEWWLGLAPGWASARVDPIVSTSVYAQCGADVGVAGAGAGVDMTLFSGRLACYGLVDLYYSGSQPRLYESFMIWDSMTVLSGHVYTYVYFYVPVFGIPPWEKKEYDWYMWNWDGYNWTGYLYNDHQDFAI